mmetsp:Transcript_309/g.392  ORF Transcript_309/g.392 Transcript_309/m.392 type:complete len:410 (+) Transcript_309:174-1403(+)
MISEEDTKIAGKELLECARYGELKELKEMLSSILPDDKQEVWSLTPKAVLDFKDRQGSTGLHRACANGHTNVLSFLLDLGAEFRPNESGNTPLHWAVQNKQLEAVKVLCERVKELDVLVQNSDGKSSLSNGFDTGDTDILKLLLEHPSAEKLQKDERKNPSKDDKSEKVQTFVHEIDYGTSTIVRCREIGFCDGKLDKDDNLETTGAVIWAASLILSQWIIQLKDDFIGKTVVELGAGCGLPGLTAYKHTKASNIYITDLMSKTFDNLQYNVSENSIQAENSPEINVSALDWCDESTWPTALVNGQTDIIVGSDLVYSLDLVAPLINVILSMLNKDGGKFVYVTTDSNRAGFSEFCKGLQDAGLAVVKQKPPAKFLKNPLRSKDSAIFDLHFGEIRDQSFHMYTFTRTK